MTLTLSSITTALSKASYEASVSAQLEKLELWLRIVSDHDVLFEHASDASDSPRVIIHAPLAIWQEAFSFLPRPGYQSLGALYRLCPELSIQADSIDLMRAPPTLELLLESARQFIYPSAAPLVNTDELSRIRGGYSKTPQGWIYYESAGNPKLPSICVLHTAGADSRQWHGLMCMPQMLENWHMVAFDVPGHGRSSLPDHSANWQWNLTQDFYSQTGDYDYSASPDETRRVAKEIKGCVFKEMSGFGHFPMTEDPERLYRLYLRDVLSELS